MKTYVGVVVSGLALLAGSCAKQGPAVVPVQRVESVAAADLPVLGTRALPTDPQKFSFVILGDKSGGLDRNWPLFDRAVQEINLLKPDFIITVGDQIEGSNDSASVVAQWELYRSHAGRFEAPLFMLPGNHDAADVMGYEYWKRNIGRTYYDFTYKGCYFLVLNTQEASREFPQFGEAQVAWAVDALHRHPNARHTFVFMHYPAWFGSDPERQRGGISAEWQRIETALGNRKYSVIAGHTHNLMWATRDGNRYLVHGATGATLTPSPVKQVGAFHHYAEVTVEADQAHIAIIEPGSIWPETIAPLEFQRNIGRLVRVQSSRQDLADGRIAMEVTAALNNHVGDTVSVALIPVVGAAGVWAPSADSLVSVLPDGGTDSLTLTFVGSRDNWYPTPAWKMVVRYHGKEVDTYGPSPLNPFSESRATVLPEWRALGTFPVGSINRDVMPGNPRAGVPGMFVPRAPDAGWNGGAPVTVDGRTYSWVAARPDSTGRVSLDRVFGIVDLSLAYLSTAIYSPVDQRVPIQIGVDNFFQLFLNGQMVPGGEAYGMPYERKILPLDLRAGWNSLYLKVVNNRGNWGVEASVIDLRGNLRFAPYPGQN